MAFNTRGHQEAQEAWLRQRAATTPPPLVAGENLQPRVVYLGPDGKAYQVAGLQWTTELRPHPTPGPHRPLQDAPPSAQAPPGPVIGRRAIVREGEPEV